MTGFAPARNTTLPSGVQVENLGHYEPLLAAIRDPSNSKHLHTTGHHWNIIARESLLGPFAELWNRFQHQLNGVSGSLPEPRLLACSLPGLLPEAIIERVDGFFIRGEFLRLAFYPNACASDEESKDGYYQPNDAGPNSLPERITDNLCPYLTGKQVVYRLLDRLPEDYKFLPSDEKNERGIAYLLNPRNKDILYEELRLIELMVQHAAEVKLILPHTSDPAEFKALRKIISDHLSCRELPQVDIGLMVETKEASRNLHKFRCNLFFPGPSDLMAELLGTTRSGFGAAQVRERLLKDIIFNLKAGLRHIKNPEIIGIKDINDYSFLHPFPVFSPPQMFMSPKQITSATGSASRS